MLPNLPQPATRKTHVRAERPEVRSGRAPSRQLPWLSDLRAFFGAGGRAGTSAVETAIVLPILITLALGCTDFARAIHAHMALTNATSAGADYGATNRFTESTRRRWEARLAAVVAEEAQSIPQFESDDLRIDISTRQSADDQLLIEVHSRYLFRTVVRWPALPDTILLRHSLTMQQYQ